MSPTNFIISPVDLEARRAWALVPGATIRVWQKIIEGGKTRLQPFDGLVIACQHGREPGATFTVRRVASGVGTEKIFPLYSPLIDKVEILKSAKVRRAKLYYVRIKSRRDIRRKVKQVDLAAALDETLDEEARVV
ncbi:MAG: 50S ribosomal protein L19 [Candidatus Vogelbacteria bacterium]|nr:50S ribosomal protein L19 [Candidatus Vogelbacteria bacterium]